MNETHSHEQRLQAEIDDLKRQLAAQKKQIEENQATRKPTGRTALVVFLLFIALCIAGYYYGYLPRQRREAVLAAESQASGESQPVVNVKPVTRSSTKSTLMLPGNIQAVTEAPILARASGYVKKRYVDIGDRVAAQQVLAEIEAPELDQQIRQARASVDQASAAVEQAQANLQQAKSTEGLLKVTAERNQRLADKGVVSRQDNDTTRLQYEAQQSTVQALTKSVAASQSSVGAAQANLTRLIELQGYLTVRAPFAGVVTLRNIDTGVLVNEGSTLLYRVATADKLRTYLNVPQTYADSLRAGLPAVLTIPDLPGKKFRGMVARTANALDPTTRTLLVEVQVLETGGVLLPGMYAQVDLAVPRVDPPLSIPSDTLLMRSTGPQVALVGADGTVHFAPIQLGRDYGDHLEVLGGLEEGQQLVVNPGDAIREGVKVKLQPAEKAAPGIKS
jgi:RND family efflux transporter MFP subunit